MLNNRFHLEYILGYIGAFVLTLAVGVMRGGIIGWLPFVLIILMPILASVLRRFLPKRKKAVSQRSRQRREFLTSYPMAIALSVLFALFLSGRIGWYFVYALLLAPFLSYLMARILSRFLSVRAVLPGQLFSKREQIQVEIVLENRAFLPSPPVALTLISSRHLMPYAEHLQISAMPRSTQTAVLNLEARLCGAAEVGAQEVVVYDYFGLFPIRLRPQQMGQMRMQVGIRPDQVAVDTRCETIENAVLASQQFQDTESVETDFWTPGGQPGYEHRDYQPGDALRRVNWKLSAKKNKMLVRTEEAFSSGKIAVLLDTKLPEPAPPVQPQPVGRRRKTPVPELSPAPDPAEQVQDMLEYGIGLAAALLDQNYHIDFYYPQEGGWQCYEMARSADLDGLRSLFAFYRFDAPQPAERLPIQMLSAGQGMTGIVCSACPDEEIAALLQLYMPRQNMTAAENLSLILAQTGGRVYA